MGTRHIAAACTLAGVLALAACGGAPPPPPDTASAPEASAAPEPPPGPAPPKDWNEAVDRMAASFWAETMRHSPTWATYLGDRSRDAELTLPTAEARDRHHTMLAGLEAGLRRIDRAKLDPRRALVADVLADTIARALDVTVCETWRWEVDQLGGPQIGFAQLPDFHTVSDEAQGRALVTRYERLGAYYDAHVANLRAGLKAGMVSPKLNVERVVRQLEAQLAQPVAEMPYATPLKVDPEPYTGFREALTAAIDTQTRRGLKAYLDFLRGELLPKAREAVGVSAMPHGETCYAAAIRYYTGLSKTPDEIHAIGLAEVDRISKEMARIAHTEDLPRYLARLKSSPEQHRDTPEALLDYNRKLLERAQAELPKAFGRLPKTKVELKQIEAFREADAPAAYYYPAPDDGSRPGYYYLNTFRPKTRLLYKMPALAYHEAVPGHHLQIALANENDALPAFMRRVGQTAFVEGWGLYAEKLAGELGLYRTPEEHIGALTYEIWRAARLVVDTGMHAKGWSRRQAIDYLGLHTGHDEGEVVNEIDRYIIWPGQALAYKLGQLEISRLRAEAKARLGDRFDLRAFHDRLLENGAVPLPVARRVVEGALK